MILDADVTTRGISCSISDLLPSSTLCVCMESDFKIFKAKSKEACPNCNIKKTECYKDLNTFLCNIIFFSEISSQ